MAPETEQPIAAFCHIPKTGGMTFHDLLRRYFGWNHLITKPARGWFYTPDDLRRDLKWNHNIRSIGGHSVRPFVDFKEFQSRLRWYTILRDPIERTISNYQHQVEKRSSRFDFNTWLQRDCNQNWQVAMLSGGQDLARAKAILRDQFTCFGTIERYHEFLLLLRHRMGWQNFNVSYKKSKNPPRTNDVRKHIKANLDQYMDNLLKANELDIALFEYAMAELYPLQVEEYGKERLESDLKTEFFPGAEAPAAKVRRWQALLFEKGIYNPLVSLLQKGTRKP